MGMSGSIVKFTLDDLIKNSDAVVVGTVTEILPAKKDETAFGITLIYTDVVIQPERYLYGKSQADRIAVRVNGGRIGDTVMIAEDEAEFTVGEECVVFLTHPTYAHAAADGFTEEDYYIVYAGFGGKYAIDDGTIFNSIDKFVLSDVEQKVAAIYGE